MGIIDRLKEIFPKTITGRQGPDVIQIDIPTEIYVKELAIYTATSLIANAISQSEIKVYKSGKSVQDEDYYSLKHVPLLYHNKGRSAKRNQQETLLLHVNVIVAGIMSKCTIKRKKIMEKHSCCQRTNTL